jgi:hypothetical protein
MSTPARSCGRAFSPLGSWQQVEATETQTFLREAFASWGMPAWLRVDNGTPWGASGGFPTALVLWLAGLGVRVWHNRPRLPQDNGVIEKSQGTAKRWAEPGQCRSAAELQERAAEADRRQREAYPYHRGKKSRMELFAALRHSGRAYSRPWEEANWKMEAAQERLACAVQRRQVDKTGRVSLYSRNLYVTRTRANTTVIVQYDPQGQRWMFSDEDGSLLGHQEATEITRERICDLTASDGRSKRDRRTTADKLSVAI